MDWQEALKEIMSHIDGIENIEEALNVIKGRLQENASAADTDNWRNRYETLHKQYVERFFANDNNTVNAENSAAERRIADEAREEEEKEEATNIKLEDLID